MKGHNVGKKNSVRHFNMSPEDSKVVGLLRNIEKCKGACFLHKLPDASLLTSCPTFKALTLVFKI